MYQRSQHPSDAALACLLLCSAATACGGSAGPVPTATHQVTAPSPPTQVSIATPVHTSTPAPTAISALTLAPSPTPVRALDPGPVAIDPDTSTLAFLVDPSEEPAEAVLEAGLYLVSPEHPTPQLVGYDDPAKEPHLDCNDSPVWSPALNAFLVTTGDDNVTLISTSGEIVRRIEGECNLPAPSHDGRLLAFESCSRIPAGIRVHSEEDGRVLKLSLGPVNSFFWGPDSAGLYYFQGSDPAQLMYVPVPEGTPRLIHADSGLEEWYWPPRFVEGP